MSLDAAIVDLQHAFVEGQGYVALSRVRPLRALALRLERRTALCVHPDVLAATIKETVRNASQEAEQAFGDLEAGRTQKNAREFL